MLWRDRKFLWLIFCSAVALTLEILSLFNVRLPPFFDAPFFALFILIVGFPTLQVGFKALFELNFKKIQFLMVVAALGAFFLGHYEEATTVIVLFTLAEKLEEIGFAKSRSAFDELMAKMPKEVELSDSRMIPLDAVQMGDRLVIKPGSMIPLDGTVLLGSSIVDESPITGEPIPRDKQAGDPLYAGSYNVNGYLEMEVTALAQETTLAKIRTLAFESAAHKAKTQTFIESFAEVYTPSVLILAFAVALLPPLFGGNFTFWFLEALTLLVISCPCALVISTPVAVYSAIGTASKWGALIKGGRPMEALASLRAIAFDKTRTLTVGKPVVTDVIPLNNQSEEHLLSCAAGIEKLAEHPLSASIVAAAQERGTPFHAVENFKAIVGKGVKADIK